MNNGMYPPGFISPQQNLMFQQVSQNGNFQEPNDDDSMLFQHSQDAQRMIYMQHMNEQQSVQDLQQLQQMQQFQQMHQMQQLQQMQQMQQMQQFQQMQQMQQGNQQSFGMLRQPQIEDDIREINQIQDFEQMQQRIQNQMESRRLIDRQSIFAEELEPIDNPQFDKRALPRHSASARSIDRRIKHAQRSHYPRSKSVGHNVDSDNRDDTRSRSRQPRSRSQHQRQSRSVRSRKAKSRAAPSPKSRSHRVVRPQTKSDDSSFVSGSSSEESNLRSDGSWNQAPNPLEIISGMLQGIGSTFQNMTVKSSDSESDGESEDSYETDES